MTTEASERLNPPEAENDGPSEPKRKPVKYKNINKEDPAAILAGKLIANESHLSHLIKCNTRIALQWKHDVKPDVDGREWVTKTYIQTESARLLNECDALIVINYGLWTSGTFSDERREAELFAGLLAIATKCDSNGEPIEDDNGLVQYRKRKPNVEAFTEVVAGRGIYSKSIRKVAESLERHRQQFLAFSEDKAPASDESKPGDPGDDESGGDGEAKKDEAPSEAEPALA